MNPEARRPMELYQWQVLGLLELLRPRTIFLEEWKGNGGGKMVLEWIQEFGPLEPLLPRILELSKMPSVTGKPPAKEFSDLVGSLGAARLHTLRYVDEVELRRTLTPEELAQSERGLLTYLACANEKGPEKCQGIVQEYSKRREAWATREIIDHLRRHPGASVVLVFGAAHRFCDDFLRENFRPAISTLEINLEEFTEKRLVPPVQHCR